MNYVVSEPDQTGPAFTFRAWDQSAGTAGHTADTTVNGATTAFSTDSDTASFTPSTIGAGAPQPSDLVEFTATDPGIGSSTVTLTPGGGDGAPVHYDTAALTDGGWTYNTPMAVWEYAGTYGTAALDPLANTVTYTLGATPDEAATANALGNGDDPIESFVVPVTDGVTGASTTVDFTVEGRNDAPVVGSDFSLGLPAGWSAEGSTAIVQGGNGLDAAELHTTSTASESDIESFLNIAPGSLASLNNASSDPSHLTPTDGSAIATDVTLLKGQTVTFSYDFISGESNPQWNDFAFFTVAGSAPNPLYDVAKIVAQVPAGQTSSNWQTYTFTADADGGTITSVSG